MPASAWSRALELAERTPETRNRYVDFLRAASICIVVIGHWLMAAPSIGGGGFSLGDMLRDAPWSQWLTWLFQVMPLFFIVGGYANAISWDSASRSPDQGFGTWSGSRLRRLVVPVVPLVLVWAGLALLAGGVGVPREMVKIGSQVAFIPTWFLAVYVMVVVVSPATYGLWRRFGLASFWGLALGAAAVDAVAFNLHMGWLRWANYGFVWLGVHQLGYLWRDGRLAGPRALWWAAGGLALLIFLVTFCNYPVSMITVPGEELSNSRPPTLALLALGVFHGGLVLAAEAPARRWLRRRNAWAATVLVNGSIMTLYLWHATVMVLLVGLAYWLGGIGLHYAPASGIWWATRPLWIALLLMGLAGFLALFARYEQRGARAGSHAAAPAWQNVLGAVAVCWGLAALTFGGISDDGAAGLRFWVVLATLAGAALVSGRGVFPPRVAPPR